MLVESDLTYDYIWNKIHQRDIFIDVTPLSFHKHPHTDSPCLVHICDLSTSEKYTFSINHYDSLKSFTLENIQRKLKTHSSRKWVRNKKTFIHLLKLKNVLDINFFADLELDIKQHNSIINRYYHNFNSVNSAIPVYKHIELFDDICTQIISKIDLFNRISNEDLVLLNDLISENFQIIESAGLKVDIQEFKKHFPDKINNIVNDFVYTEYNLYTLTGRPSNRFGGINYAALNKDNGCRNSFISRFDKGTLLLIDYSAYHPHLIAELVNYELPDNVYEYLGKFFFNKEVLSETDIQTAKELTFRVIYGHVPVEYRQIPFLKKIREYIKHRWDFFIANGYIESPIYKRRIDNVHIKTPNPTKLFSYIIQASETEYNIKILDYLNRFLSNKHSKAILYTYDSVLFDIHPDEFDIIPELQKIMYNNKFPIKCYTGDTLHKLNKITME